MPARTVARHTGQYTVSVDPTKTQLSPQPLTKSQRLAANRISPVYRLPNALFRQL